jgi:hypothetical protein
LIEKIGGEDHGTRNFALAAWRAYTGDYSVMAVLGPLTPGDRDNPTQNQALPLAGLFFARYSLLKSAKLRAFSLIFRYDP